MPLYFRGYRNWQAIILRLSADFGLDKATDLVVSGDSAGGLSTYWHADGFQQMLPNTRVVAAPDSGYFYDFGWQPWGDELAALVALNNGTAGLNQGCVAAKVAAGYDPVSCAFPDISTPYIQTPLFVMNSRYDPALDDIVANENGKNATNVQLIGDTLQAYVQLTALNRPGNAAFLTSCHQHCGQWAQGQVTSADGVPGDFNVTIDGYTAPQAFDEWFGRRSSRQLWLQEAKYPCATCCDGGQA